MSAKSGTTSDSGYSSDSSSLSDELNKKKMEEDLTRIVIEPQQTTATENSSQVDVPDSQEIPENVSRTNRDSAQDPASTAPLSDKPSPNTSPDIGLTGSPPSAASGASKTSKVRSGDLPPSSYDGSHLHWKVFRQQVLAPHRIRVVELAPKEQLPEALLIMIDAGKDTTRFDAQKVSFREQVNVGRGFGPSPLFPPNLLPPIDNESMLSRCMVPTFSREALPERTMNRMGPLYELSVPRPALGCGFSCSALTSEEIKVLPSFLVTTGTVVHYDTGYIAPGAASYCPFLVFERTYGSNEHRLEAAYNQCAIGGAWTVRALQLLYSKAWRGQMMPELPVSFSCALDNNLAIINFHWIDHSQAYCSSPLCKFDLSNDDHFTKFLVWIECIGKWALTKLLPIIKEALVRISKQVAASTSSPNAKLSLSTNMCPDDVLIRSLKTTFDDIPWRFEDDDCTPVSSSTASWGSPIISDTTAFPFMSAISPGGSANALNMARKRMFQGVNPNPGIPASQLPHPPIYAASVDLMLQKRLSHAMNEIHDLNLQLSTTKSELENANVQLKKEVSGLRATVSSMLRKESLGWTLGMNSSMINDKPPYASGYETWSVQFQQQRRCISTYQRPNASPLTLDPDIPSQSHTLTPGKQPTGADEQNISQPGSKDDIKETVIVLDGTQNDARNQVNKSGEKADELLSPPMTARRIGSMPTIQIQSPVTPGMPSPAFSIMSNDANVIVVPPPPPAMFQENNLWKLATLILVGLLVANTMPAASLRVFVLACVVDLCILAFASAHYPSSIGWLISMFPKYAYGEEA